MRLLIDGLAADLPAEQITLPSDEGDRLADLSAVRQGRTLQLKLPATPTNNRLLGRPRDSETATRFNATTHRATLEAEGATLFEGVIRLLASDDEAFTVDLRQGGAAWASRAALQPLDALGIDYTVRLDEATIRASWRDEQPVKFFPIHRDSYEEQSNSTDLLTAQRVLSLDDYHPFLHAETLVHRIFAEAGYTIDSRFFESELFRSLYISGAYATKQRATLAAHIGFLAGRLTTASATADAFGRVYLNPYSEAHSVGNLVETATPYQTDETGTVRYEFFNNGNCFYRDADGAICYRPTSAAAIGFDHRIRYTTEHRIASRTRLTGFDSLYLGPNNELRFELLNRYEDRRNALNNNQRYRLIIFDHTEGAQYRLRYTIDGVVTTWAILENRANEVVSAELGLLESPTLDCLIDSRWQPYEGDWAIYDGYIEERGETTVELRICTAPEQLEANTVKRFDTAYLFGAEEGMRLTLHTVTTLAPRFDAGAGYGSTLAFKDVAQLGIRQIELLEALAHLFNLRFATDEGRRTVRIEPEEELYARGVTVDWRERVDRSQPIRHLDLTPTLHAVQTRCYAEGDGAVHRLEEEQGTPFGSYSVAIDSAAALLGEQRTVNPLFAPTCSATAESGSAPSALLMQVGDRDAADTTPITPRIVRFLGMRTLPEGEQWSYLNGETAYPLAVFHFAGDDEVAATTLCFEDRDGAEGLHRYHDHQQQAQMQGGRIELTVRVAPWEYEALEQLDTGMADRTSTFLLRTCEGECTAHLHQLGPYNPATGRLRCTFNRCTK